jgi:hypothetical protein
MVDTKNFCGNYFIQYRFFPGGGPWRHYDLVPADKVNAYLRSIETASREVRAIPDAGTSYAAK